MLGYASSNLMLRYVSLNLRCRDLDCFYNNAFAAQLHCKPEGFFRKPEGINYSGKQKAYSENRKVSPEDAEGFF